MTEETTETDPNDQDPKAPIKINTVITADDIDARMILSMKENSVSWLTSLHALAVQGKTWKLEEPEAAEKFLKAAQDTTQYRPGRIFFEQLEIDEEILNLKPLSKTAQKDMETNQESGVQIMQTFAPLLGIMQGLGNTSLNANEMLNKWNEGFQSAYDSSKEDQPEDPKVKLVQEDFIYDLLVLGKLKQDRDTARASFRRHAVHLEQVSTLTEDK